MKPTEELSKRIINRIRTEGAEGWLRAEPDIMQTVNCISFRDYMDMCLYDEVGGYYRSGALRIGKTGDFYTSSAIGSVMGDKLAVFIARVIDSFGGNVYITEWGAGTGRLSRHILAAWERLDHPWMNSLTYSVIEGNPVHLAEARRTIGEGGYKASVRFMTPEDAERTDWSGKPHIVFANELLDAFPVHRVVWKNGRLWELGVTCAADAGNEAKSGGRDSSLFRYAFMPLTDPRIAESLKADGIVLREDQEFEVNLAAERWISLVGRLVEDGALIIIDYGHEAAELAAPHRMRGTLLCYKEHVAHDDPFVAAGRQDITAHVNFSACRRAAEGSGWEAFYYDTQKQFLVDQGILNDLIAHDGSDPFGEAAKSNRAIRQLLLSDNMSEAFKVLALRKRREL